ncbi:MAG TPA: NTP transferase domain-containing protein [Bdellovibrionota bacterium]|nr:NTP transferase domain-containing protein [Bdellovibrionota bacterium]
MNINTALILAAGEGSRLVTQKLPFPKPLQLCHDLSLAERSLTALHQHGINKFYVTLGYKKDEVKAHFQEIASKFKLHVEFIEVADWQKGNGVSALAAQTQLKNSSFLLTMVDHAFEREFIAQFLSSINESEDEICLAVDFKPSEECDLVDATKVEIKNQYIKKIGKDLRDWQGVDTGLFYCTSVLFKGLQAASKNKLYTLSHGIENVAADKKVRAIDVSSYQWFDIDTPQDMHIAQKKFKSDAKKY